MARRAELLPPTWRQEAGIALGGAAGATLGGLVGASIALSGHRYDCQPDGLLEGALGCSPGALGYGVDGLLRGGLPGMGVGGRRSSPSPPAARC